MKKRCGVTLVELLTVVALLGILLAVAFPLARGVAVWSLRAAASEMAVRMREARMTAIACGQTCTLTFYTFSNRYRVADSSGTAWVLLPEGVSIASTNFPLVNNRPTLYFRYTGAPNRGGHVALRDHDGNRLYVIVTPVTGRVRVDSSPP